MAAGLLGSTVGVVSVLLAKRIQSIVGGAMIVTLRARGSGNAPERPCGFGLKLVRF